jgi:hypothetical protein
MGSALYEPIHRQGTRNPRGGPGCMDGVLFNQTPELNQENNDRAYKNKNKNENHTN